MHIRVPDEAPPRAPAVVKTPGTLIPSAEVIAEALVSGPKNLSRSLLAPSWTSRYPAFALPLISRLGPDALRETPPFVTTLAQRGAVILTGRVSVRVVPDAAHGVGRRVMQDRLRPKTFAAHSFGRLVRM